MFYKPKAYSWIPEDIPDASALTEDELISLLDGEQEDEREWVPEMSNGEVFKIIESLISQLSDVHQTLLRTKFLEGKDCSIRSLGATVPLSKTRINVQYHRALKALKNLLLTEYPALFVALQTEMVSPKLGRPTKSR